MTGRIGIVYELERIMGRDSAIEIYAGIECSVVRIQDGYRDQLQESNHFDNLDNLDAIAELGIRTLRYPILIDHVSPNNPVDRDWSKHDLVMDKLSKLGIMPIVGFVHHGGGPKYTNLLDNQFPNIIADFARDVATRYPWINYWTPINEPLTTARFSGLYGIWYPHLQDNKAFLRMVHNQCRATLLSMRVLKEINPNAHLIQTEDISKTFSTKEVKHVADSYNQRRWLSLDLLYGTVDRAHPWYMPMIDAGVPIEELRDYSENIIGQFTIGMNHYLSSDRWLDHRVDIYPAFANCGGMVDTEACRVRDCDNLGIYNRLREVWLRYPGHPLIVAECHLGDTEEEQIRWIHEAWTDCLKLKAEGANVKALTLWSTFGSLDWNSLLQQHNNHYEPGLFNVKEGKLQKTLLTELVKNLILSGDFYHPALDTKGWWHQDNRFHF